jgi:phosphopentomutase
LWGRCANRPYGNFSRTEEVIDPTLHPKVEAVLEELKEKMTEGIAEIRKRADIGAFDISEEAVNALRTLQKELDEAVTKAFGSAREHFNLKLAAVNKCLDSMRSIAKNDLEGPMKERECFNSFWRALKR